MRLSGKTAVVTGANRGIGAAISVALAADGASIICHARHEQDAKRAAGIVDGAAVFGDLADSDAIRSLADQVQALTDTVGVLVLNAGVLRRGGVADTTLVDMQETLAVNTFAPVLLTQALLAQLRAGRARIVVVSSTMGQFSSGMRSGSLPYRISKAGVNAFVASASDELASAGILINAMHPGWVRTAMGGSGATVDPADAARTALQLATLPDDGPTGQFFRDGRRIDW
jgi:NAD(P)-dependent dehydrogenase (short-subunit alcohol dehydrogenase family)